MWINVTSKLGGANEITEGKGQDTRGYNQSVGDKTFSGPKLPHSILGTFEHQQRKLSWFHFSVANKWGKDATIGKSDRQ